jgi:hypothetical protein
MILDVVIADGSLNPIGSMCDCLLTSRDAMIYPYFHEKNEALTIFLKKSATKNGQPNARTLESPALEMVRTVEL